MSKTALALITSILAFLFFVINLLLQGNPTVSAIELLGLVCSFFTVLFLAFSTQGKNSPLEVEEDKSRQEPEVQEEPLPAPPLFAPNLSLALGPNSQEEIRVLVIDDEPSNLIVVQKHLEKEGYQIETAINGFAGMDIVEERPPHLIIVDLMMPEMTGLEFCEKIREYFDSVTLPIMILTARHEVDDMIEGLKAGANDYLTKPFHYAELVARVRGLLKIQELGLVREELAKRKLTEQELNQTKSRLSQLIEHSLNGIFVLDESFNISFINQVAANSLEGVKQDLLGTNFSNLFDTTEEILKDLGYAEKQLTISSNQKEVQVSFIPIENEKGIAFAGMISESMIIKAGDFMNLPQGQNKQSSIEKLETLCQGVISIAEKEGSSVLGCLQQLEKNLDTVSEDIKIQNERKQLVDIMLAALSTWEAISKKGKVELAEESSIWRASLDGSVYRTRTLDKYLSYDLLPAKPRWKDVIHTAEFVLEQKGATKSKATHLKTLLENFQPWEALEVE